MMIWLILGQDTTNGNWEVMKILFNAASIQSAIAEIFAECTNYEELQVEYWYRDDANKQEAEYYGTIYCYREEDLDE